MVDLRRHHIARSWRAPTLLAAAGGMFPGRVLAHADEPMVPHDLWRSWNFDPLLLALVGTALAIYAAGLVRLWRRAGASHGVASWQVLCHGIGMTLLIVALVSPLDPLGETLSVAHMAQHMLLILAAPFLVLSAPLAVYLWALPRRWRKRVAGPATRRWPGRIWRLIARPGAAWGLYAFALWAWHAPTLYQAALEVDWLHDLEHFSFLGTACVFWWVVLRIAAPGAALAMLFTTMLHSGLLAALMIFAPTPWYPAYANTTAPWGLTPLEDQHLAGLAMWIPGGVGYLIATLAVLVLWLRRLEVRAVAVPTPAPPDVDLRS